MTYAEKPKTILDSIIQQLDCGDIEGASKDLFNPRRQNIYTKNARFWYAQILVAALQGKGFHIAFLTAYEEKDLKPYSRARTDRIVDIGEMILFFRSYLNHPEYLIYRQKIEELIAFYENGTCEDPFKNTIVPTT